MPMFALGKNLDDISSGFEPLPDADYLVRVMKWEVQEKDSGPYLNMEAEVFGNDDLKLNGRKLWIGLSMVDKALWKLKGFLVAAEVPWTKKGFDPEHCLGKELGVTVRIKEYEGESRNEIKKFFKMK